MLHLKCFRAKNESFFVVDGSFLEIGSLLCKLRSRRVTVFVYHLFEWSGNILSKILMETVAGSVRRSSTASGKFCFRLYCLRRCTRAGCFQAVARFDIQGLFDLMKDNPTNFQWIKMRIERMWPRWVAAYRSLEEKQNWTLVGRAKKKVHIQFFVFFYCLGRWIYFTRGRFFCCMCRLCFIWAF